MICAGLSAGGAATVFSWNGKALHTLPFGGEVVATTQEGGFLLKHESFFRALSPTGSLRWEMQPFQVYPVWGIIPSQLNGWLAVGPSREGPPGIGFSRIDERGNEIWSAMLPDESFPRSRGHIILKAPDASLRVLAMTYAGITVRSFLVGNFQ
jgi:hypothetical protein